MERKEFKEILKDMCHSGHILAEEFSRKALAEYDRLSEEVLKMKEAAPIVELPPIDPKLSSNSKANIRRHVTEIKDRNPYVIFQGPD